MPSSFLIWKFTFSTQNCNPSTAVDIDVKEGDYLTFSTKVLNGDNLTTLSCFGMYPLGCFRWRRGDVAMVWMLICTCSEQSKSTLNWNNPGNRESVAWCQLVAPSLGVSWVRRPSSASGTQGSQAMFLGHAPKHWTGALRACTCKMTISVPWFGVLEDFQAVQW